MNNSTVTHSPPDFSEVLQQTLGEGFMVILISSCFLLLLSLAISIWGLVVLMSSMNAVPERHRRMAPGLVWLNLIPCFNLVWSWFLAIWIPESLRAAFKEASIEGVPDGRVKGIAYAASLAVTLFLGFCAGGLAPMFQMPPPVDNGSEEIVVTSTVYITQAIQFGLGLIPLILFILFFLEVKSAANRLRDLGEGA